MPLIITPVWLGFPERMGSRRGWGLAAQLYSVRSEASWGVGDLADLADLAVWSSYRHGADFVLINPLHAAEPVAPMEPSPYLPASRRFANPLFLHPERIAEYADCTDLQRAEIRALREGLDPRSATVDRNYRMGGETGRVAGDLRGAALRRPTLSFEDAPCPRR